VEATSAQGATVTYAAATSSDAVSTPVVTYSQASGTAFPLGETLVTATATDEAGNAESCTFKVTVRDTTAPGVTCPDTITVEAVDARGTTVSWSATIATDAVTDSLTIAASPPSGATFGLGVTKVTVTATDTSGNQGTCQFVVHVVDTVAPQVACPADVFTEATASDGAVVNFSPPNTADAVSAPTITLSAASGSTFALGTTTVVATAVDAANNVATCTFTVTVQDTTAPLLACPADVVEEATGPEGALVMFPVPMSTDFVSTPTVTLSRKPMTPFPLGDTTVEVSSADAVGNESSCSFHVTVQDTTPPVLVVPTDLVIEALSSDGAVVAFPSATATDLVTLVPATTFEPASGTQLPLGETLVTVTATDAAQNTATERFRVSVVDTTAPQILCPADLAVTADSELGAAVHLPRPIVTDSVTATPTIAFDHPADGVYPVGTTPLVATATDGAGNSASCGFNVLVTRVSMPVQSGSCACGSGSPASVAAFVMMGLALMRRRRGRF
jgi:uncharacterized protein (TIGR03382 family)